MRSSWRTFLVCGLFGLIAGGPALPLAAAEQTAKDFLNAIYSAYVGKDAPGVRLDKPATARLFTPGLLRLIEADSKRAAKRGEVPGLDGDPFADAQDWEITSFTIDVQDSGPGKARAVVKFKNGDQDRKVSLDLVKLQSGWRIDEITGADGSLRALLTKK